MALVTQRTIEKRNEILYYCGLEKHTGTNHIEAKIDKIQKRKSRFCGKNDETVNYITRKLSGLAQTPRKLGTFIHW